MFCSPWDCRWNPPVPPSVSPLANGQMRKKSPLLLAHLSELRSEPKTRANMPPLRQLEFAFEQFPTRVAVAQGRVTGQALRLPSTKQATEAVALQLGRAVDLEAKAHQLLRSLGANRIVTELRVEWNSRLKTAAGRADYRQKLISLNPLLVAHPEEIERTLRHELAHILAQFRAGRRRISPHG